MDGKFGMVALAALPSKCPPPSFPLSASFVVPRTCDKLCCLLKVQALVVGTWGVLHTRVLDGIPTVVKGIGLLF